MKRQFLLFMAIGFVLLANATTWTVTNSNAVVATNPDFVTDVYTGSLQYCVANAANGDIINFDAALSGAIIEFDAMLTTPNVSLTIDAKALTEPIIFDGKDANNIIKLGTAYSSGVIYTVKGIIFKRGYNTTTNLAGAISTTNELIVENCSFLDNNNNVTASGSLHSAGAIIVVKQGINVQIRDCIFNGNKSTYRGGALYLTQTRALIERCYFTGNEGWNSAVLYMSNTGSDNLGAVEFRNCTMVNNSATSGNDGTVVCNDAAGASNQYLRFINCTVYGNVMNMATPTSYKPAIFSKYKKIEVGGNLMAKNNTVGSNNAADVRINTTNEVITSLGYNTYHDFRQQGGFTTSTGDIVYNNSSWTSVALASSVNAQGVMDPINPNGTLYNDKINRIPLATITTWHGATAYDQLGGVRNTTLNSVGAVQYKNTETTGGNISDLIAGLTANQKANATFTVTTGELVINEAAEINGITFKPGAKLTLDGGTLTAANGITLESNASGMATFVDNNNTTPQAVSGTVKQSLGGTRNWYLTSPVASATVPAGQTYYTYDETGSNNGYTTPATAYWVAKAAGSALDSRLGYIAQPTQASTISFTGTLNTGAITPITLTRTTTADKPGFNLVANPYPSYLDWKMVAAENTGLSKTAWFRTKDTNGDYIFATVNVANPESPSIVAVNPNTIITTLIPPMQAYWVRVNSGSATYNVNNLMRKHFDNVDNKFKAPKQSSQQSVRLRVSNGSQADEALIVFNANATDGLDMFDSPKMSNTNLKIPEIYTKAGTEKLVINGLSEVRNNFELPIGFTTSTAGSFTLKATELTNFDSNTRVYLRDSEVEEVELVPGTEYNFSTSAPTANNESRFSLIFRAPGITTEAINPEKENVSVFVNTQNEIVINANAGSNYAIYNTVGQQIESGVLNSKFVIRNLKLNTGVYVVKVGNVTERVIIK